MIPQITALDIFAEITKIIPQDVEVNLSTIEITLQNIFIKGEIDNFENVDVLYEALKKYNCLKNLQRTNMTTDKNTRKVIFNFDGKISC